MSEKYNLITPENIQGELIKNEIELNNLRVQAFKEQKYNELLRKNQKYKEVIDKANKKLNNFIEYWDMFERFNKQIKDILKEVE